MAGEVTSNGSSFNCSKSRLSNGAILLFGICRDVIYIGIIRCNLILGNTEVKEKELCKAMRLAEGWVACTFTGCILKLVVYGEETEQGGKEKKLCKAMRLAEGWAACTFTGCILKQVVYAQDTLQ